MKGSNVLVTTLATACIADSFLIIQSMTSPSFHWNTTPLPWAVMLLFFMVMLGVYALAEQKLLRVVERQKELIELKDQLYHGERKFNDHLVGVLKRNGINLKEHDHE